MLFSTLSILALANSATAAIYDTRFQGTTWDDDKWIITTTNLDQGHYQSRFSIANGYLGINVAAVGPFFDVDVPVNGDNIQGWPLFDRRQSFATIAGFWDAQATTASSNFVWLNQYGGESVISGVPHWAGLHVRVGNDLLDSSVPARQISDFRSSLDVRNAVMSWEYTWTPSSSDVPIEVRYDMLVHKLHVNQAAVRVALRATRDVNVTVIDLLEGDCAVRSTFVDKGYETDSPSIWSAVRPNGIENVTAYVRTYLTGDDACDFASRRRLDDPALLGGNSSSIAQAVDVNLSSSKVSTVFKFVGAASHDAFPDPERTAMEASCAAAQAGWEALLDSHSREWKSIMPADSVDNFRNYNGSLPLDTDVQELQITAITNPFQLLQQTVSDNAVLAAGNNTNLQVNSISVCGLGSSCYAGLVFWDVEVWMQPGLVVSFPRAARQIARYRVERFGQAQENILTAYQSSQNATGKLSPKGAIFPWTSGRFGNCTGTGPCFDYEYHLNGDIGLAIWNYWTVTGDTAFFREQLFPVYEAIAQMYADLVTYNQSTSRYDLYNATDPDEYANFQDNVGFGMVLISSHLNNTNFIRDRFGLEPNVSWTNISASMTIPVNNDADIILEYASQNGSIVVKQADVVLIDDFLEYQNPYTLSDLNYYAAAQSPDGPAMTYGVFAIVANREIPSGCSSYTYDLYGSQPYIRGPWFQFSEQLVDDASTNGGTHPAFPFLTGVGGANRVAIFGYLGLRLNPDILNIDPSLPPQIPQLEYRTIYWNGWPVKARSNQTHTVLTRQGAPLPEVNETFANSPIPVTVSLGGTTVHNLALNKTLVLPNRQPGLQKSVPGNLAQCRPVSTSDAYEPGQFPLAAVDGAASTKWQPSYSNTTSTLTVSLSEPFVPISQIRFDWAQAPPTSFRVLFSNLSDSAAAPPLLVAHSANISLSSPYDPSSTNLVRPYTSNTTNISLAQPVWSSRFAILEIEGNQATRGTPNERNGTGASVAEWAMVAASGEDLKMTTKQTAIADDEEWEQRC